MDFSNTEILFLGLAYLIGSIPTGHWFARFFFDIDITEHGSGNIGATNVARVLGKKYFLLIFFLDAFKAYAVLYAALSAGLDSISVQILLAVCLLIGNAYSLFLNFNGGKGVATAVGTLAFLAPLSTLMVFLSAWIITLGFTKKPFFASLVSIIMTTIWALMFSGETELVYFLVFLVIWLIVRHKKNIMSHAKACAGGIE